MIKFTLTDFTAQSLYDAQIIHITTVQITAAIICHCVSFFCSLIGSVVMVFEGRTKKPLNEGKKQTMWSHTAGAL
jgi:hypothetical protein